MNTQSNQWTLFGFDVRTLGHQWLAAWRAFLHSDHTPLRREFDEPVSLHSMHGCYDYQGGVKIEEEFAQRPRFKAVELTDDLVLQRTLKMPSAVETELSSVLAIEVAAASPFSAQDTVYGARELSRHEDSIILQLAIASRSGVSEWVNGQDWIPAAGDAEDLEIWADVDGAKIRIEGFGEGAREKAYKRRLLRFASIGVAVMLLLLLSSSLFAIQQRAALGNLEALLSSANSRSGLVSMMRESLAHANEVIEAANEIVKEYPNPHFELARLTDTLGDDVFLAHFSMKGGELRVRGRATDAALVMQTLAEIDDYASVTAPQAITSVGTTGLEQFHLDISLNAPSDAGMIEETAQ